MILENWNPGKHSEKQGRLTEAEYMVMKEHVENAVEMIRYPAGYELCASDGGGAS